MVLGLRAKTRKVQLDYIIHIQEIKPWPPSQSLRTLRTVLIQWEHGDKTSGSTNQVVPSLGNGSGVGDGRIEFNESFRLQVTLTREKSIKGVDEDIFQKNCIEFNLFEPRRDKTVKGQLLGTAVLDLAEYGVVKENLSISVPISCKRSYRNTVQPLLLLNIQPVERNRTSSSSRGSMTREASIDMNPGESVSALMSEEYAEEAEVGSFTTDDDVSSHSSLAVASSAADSNGSSSPQNKENSTVAVSGNAGKRKVNHVPDQIITKPNEERATESHVKLSENPSRSSSIDLSSDISWISKRITSQSLQLEETEKQQNNINSMDCEREANDIREDDVKGRRNVNVQLRSEEGTLKSPVAEEAIAESDYQTDKYLDSGFIHRQDDKISSSTAVKDKRYIERNAEEEGDIFMNEPLGDLSQVDAEKQVTLENGLLSSTKDNFAVQNSFSNIDRSKNRRSVRSAIDSSKTNRSTGSSNNFLTDTVRGKVYAKETRNLPSDSRIQHLEHKIKVLEGELREAAAIEASLYSVVAEHGSSMNKVHAPARRLSRLYFHANKEISKSGRRTAARSVVSGLVLVAKACGNDVPRLTFWLSNSIVLRVIISKSFGESHFPISAVSGIRNVGERNGQMNSPLKWEPLSYKSTRGSIERGVDDWENPLTFAAALEKLEAWIFSRIVESLWWQTFTPHMQSGAAKAVRISMDSDSNKLLRRTSSSIDQQGNYSMELWKKAFRDACERICPVRGGGHDCGCLPVLSKMIMEQLIARLDVAMFNAILRESADDIPTDPVADPISDADVLPIPAGKASFGAGAQLKNAIGNWSRWLTDLFGIDDEDVDNLLENDNNSETTDDDERISRDKSSKSFHLLNALSDLMMLPKDMLLSRTIRKEVCPTFGPPLIRRILNSFIPDEFCPDPIPRVVLEALNSEESFDHEEDSIMTFPCAATPIEYQAPSVASIASVVGEIGTHSKLPRTGSSVLKKSQTSDDELDELDSPLKSIILDRFQSSSPSSLRPGWISNENGDRNTSRYQLLKEVWMNCE